MPQSETASETLVKQTDHYNLSVIASLHSGSPCLLVIYIHSDPDAVLTAAALHPLSISL